MKQNNKKLNCKNCQNISCAAGILTNNQLELLTYNSIKGHVKKGRILSSQGSLVSHIIYLRSGLVKEYMIGPNNKEQIFQILKQRTYLGLQSLFGDKINHYSYAALSDIDVCYIDINVFRKLVKQNGEFAYEILVSVCRDSINSYRKFVNQSQKRIYGKVAEALLYFSKIIYEANSFTLPLNRTEFANLIGTSRESASRTLSKFNKEGIINLKNNIIEITQPKKLDEICQHG